MRSKMKMHPASTMNFDANLFSSKKYDMITYSRIAPGAAIEGSSMRLARSNKVHSFPACCHSASSIIVEANAKLT